MKFKTGAVFERCYLYRHTRHRPYCGADSEIRVTDVPFVSKYIEKQVACQYQPIRHRRKELGVQKLQSASPLQEPTIRSCARLGRALER